ncbi:MAG TPA: hypothetical protein VFS40_08910 [Gemmatimonadales bacterium]|nr:hypothetical protein [Gemmatimonadales bacterium]
MTFHPEQRRATAALLTDLGWCQGTLHLPPMQSLMDFLNSGSPIVKLTRARVPSPPEPFAFVAVRREAIHLVAPTMDELVETPGAIGHTTPRDVVVLLDAGRVTGRLEVLRNLRVSDFLRQQMGLVALREATFTPHDATDPAATRRFPVALVNLARATGVAQTSGNGN